MSAESFSRCFHQCYIHKNPSRYIPIPTLRLRAVLEENTVCSQMSLVFTSFLKMERDIPALMVPGSVARSRIRTTKEQRLDCLAWTGGRQRLFLMSATDRRGYKYQGEGINVNRSRLSNHSVGEHFK